MIYMKLVIPELEGSKKDRKRKKKAALAAVAKRTEPVAMATTESVAMVTEEDKEIAALLEAKKQELLQQGAADLDTGREKVKAEGWFYLNVLLQMV